MTNQFPCSISDRLEQTLLSKDGAFYLVAVSQNKPYEIIERMKAQGLDGEVCSVSSELFWSLPDLTLTPPGHVEATRWWRALAHTQVSTQRSMNDDRKDPETPCVVDVENSEVLRQSADRRRVSRLAQRVTSMGSLLPIISLSH